MERENICDSHDAAQYLKEKFNCDHAAASSMVRAEAEAEIERERAQRRRLNYSTAVNIAVRRIEDWITHHAEYRVDLSWESLANFSSSHRIAVVWAVSHGRARSIEQEVREC